MMMITLVVVLAAEDPPPPPPQWNLGAGVGVTLISSAPQLGTLGGLGMTPLLAPQLTAGFERHLTQGLWLTFAATAMYSQTPAYTQPSLVAGGTATAIGPSTSAFGSGALGLRWVINTGGIVEISPYLRLNAGGGRSHTSYVLTGGADVVQRYDTISLAGTLGLALERKLIEGLALRLTTDLFRVAWAAVRPENSTAAATTTVALVLSPSLELRYYF